MVALWNENLTRNWHTAFQLRNPIAPVLILAVPPSSYIILAELFNFSLPQVPHI